MKNQSEHKLATISFATVNSDGVDLWPTIPACDYIEANRLGRARATEILQYAVKNQAPMILGHVVAAIISKALHGAGEVGFFHEIAKHCIESSNNQSDTGVDIIPTDLEVCSTLRLVTN